MEKKKDKKSEKHQDNEILKPFVHLGPDCPTLFYPRGKKKVGKFPGFVVHKDALRPDAYLFPSGGEKSLRRNLSRSKKGKNSKYSNIRGKSSK